jgi:hypothetical protein
LRWFYPFITLPISGSNTLKLVLSSVSLVSAIVGITGGALVKRQRKMAGVLMLVAAAGAFITVASTILLLFGGLFLLILYKKPLLFNLYGVLSYFDGTLLIVWSTLNYYFNFPLH